MRNILLYLSAFLPMYFLICVKKCIELLTGGIEFDALTKIVFIFMILAIFLGALGLYLEIFNKRQKVEKIEIISKQNITDQHFLGYFSLFVLFALSFNLNRLSMFIVFVLILVMIGVVYVKNKLFYINPFLNIMGFNFYDIVYKISGETKTRRMRIFFKGQLEENKEYKVKIKDENFSFLDKQR